MNNEIWQQLEHKDFILEIDRQKMILKEHIAFFEQELAHYLSMQPRTEQMYQSYLECLTKRDEQIALLAELSSCSFSVPPEPTLQEFQAMNYQFSNYLQTFETVEG